MNITLVVPGNWQIPVVILCGVVVGLGFYILRMSSTLIFGRSLVYLKNLLVKRRPRLSQTAKGGSLGVLNGLWIIFLILRICKPLVINRINEDNIKPVIISSPDIFRSWML